MRILKYVVPVDDQDHTFNFRGDIVHVNSQSYNTVEFWFKDDQAPNTEFNRTFRVFGTGHIVPNNYKYIGTSLVHPFVWHLFEKMD